MERFRNIWRRVFNHDFLARSRGITPILAIKTMYLIKGFADEGCGIQLKVKECFVVLY